jgi:hypothetical protein
MTEQSEFTHWITQDYGDRRLRRRLEVRSTKPRRGLGGRGLW